MIMFIIHNLEYLLLESGQDYKCFLISINFMEKKTTGGSRRAGNPRENNFDRELPKYTQIGNACTCRASL